MEIATEETIAASSGRVWTILADVRRYPEWNPFIRSLQGTLGPGERIRFSFAVTSGFAVTVTGRLLAVVPGRELRWAGQLLVPWLFRAEHYHVLEPLGEGATRFRHGERFSGLLLPVAWPFLRVWGPGRYRAVNAALKLRAEETPSAEGSP